MWRIMNVINEVLLDCDPNDQVPGAAVKDIQVEVLSGVFSAMSDEKRSELIEDDYEFIRQRVRSMVWNSLNPAPERRFSKLDRVVCRIGGSRGWAPGSIQSLNEEDPSDPTGQSRLAYVVKIDPPESRLVSVPQDSNEYARAEVCFGQRAGARWFTRMCLPKAVRKGSQRAGRRFKQTDRVACAVEDSTSNYTEWAPGTVVALDHKVEDEGGVPGGVAPYEVKLDSGSTVLVHVDEHRLVRDLALQPAGPRIAEDGTRCLKRMSKRKADDGGWEVVDHMCARALASLQSCTRVSKQLCIFVLAHACLS